MMAGWVQDLNQITQLKLESVKLETHSMMFILESTYIQYGTLHSLELKAYLENQQKDFSFLFCPCRQTRHPEPVGGEDIISLFVRKS
jgi:hypothetical protein